MNREIKFRAWGHWKRDLSDEPRMYYGYPIANPATPFMDSEGCFPDEIISITHKNYGWKWMQFTGLKDKNGKEIYEGDILEVDDWNVKEQPLVVEFLDGCFYIKDTSGQHWVNNPNIHPTKIIGNVYENPELLK